VLRLVERGGLTSKKRLAAVCTVRSQMVTIIHRRAEGLVPFDPFRHLGQVVALISQAFEGELGPASRHALRRMQRVARWGGFGLWLWEVDVGARGAPGFVWLEGGKVVGNISLRRAVSAGGWMIGNVAVHPDWQRRGIGHALVKAAVETAAERNAAWVGLEVRESNVTARRMYEGMGFEQVGTMLELLRPSQMPWPRQPPPSLPLRRARAADGRLLYQLALEGLDRPHREVLEVRRSTYRTGWEDRLAAWLEGSRREWWVVEEDRIEGALGTDSRWPARWHQIEVLVRRERLDDLGPRLVQAGLGILSKRRPWETTTSLPGLRARLEPAFVGFRRARRLVQMRLSLAK